MTTQSAAKLELVITEDRVLATKTVNGHAIVKTTSFEGMLMALNSKMKFDSGFIDPHVSRMARDGQSVYLLAYDAPRVRQVSFARRATDVETFTIPTPPCLFFFSFEQQSNPELHRLRSARVVCIVDPFVLASTHVYRFPFSNCHEPHSGICWGSAEVTGARYRLNPGVSDLINTYWNARFNHDLDYGRNTLERFQELDGQAEFPLTTLIRHSHFTTVDDFFTKSIRGG